MSETVKNDLQLFQDGEAIARRREQITKFRPIAREILHELIQKDRITDDDLTGLIHLFRPNPVPHELALKYLNHIVSDPHKAKALAERLVATGLGGYTAPGRLRIHSHAPEELLVVRDFLRDAFKVNTTDEAAQLCKAYETKDIRYVTAGIYSPWLHYINPELFPILNGATRAFFRDQGLPKEYPALVAKVTPLAEQLGVKDLGVLDSFVWHQSNSDQPADPKNGAWRKAKWVKSIPRQDWDLFFDACNDVIDRFGLEADDPLLAMNMHTSSSDGVLMNISNRATIDMHLGAGPQVMLMLPKGDTERLLSRNEVVETFVFSKPANAEGTRVTMATFRQRFDDLMPAVLTASEEIIGRSESSPFRKHHIPDLYRMATDADFREQALDHLLEGKGEWPGGKAGAGMNYWVFQANPKWYDAIGALRDSAVDRWSIDVHKQRIKPGDKAIIWVTGPGGGCSALATVQSPVQPMDSGDASYARSPDFAGVHDRVHITIDHNLWDHPIPKEEASAALPGLKAGIQGTTFSATKEQYDYFLQRAQKNKQDAMHDLNTILYGPPGTGKTHHTVTYAVAIIEDKPFEQIQREAETVDGRKSVRERYERYLVNGQVKAVTFHQSMSYEDFVEGIKPVLGEAEAEGGIQYELKDGIFKAICTSARSALKLRSTSGHGHPVIPAEVLDLASFWKASIGYYTDPEDDAIYEYCMDNDVFAMGWGESADLSNTNSVEEIAERLKSDGVGTEGRVLTFTKYLRLEMEEGDVVFVSEGNDSVRAIGVVSGPYFMNPDAPIRYKQFRKVNWIYKDLQLPVSDFYANAFAQGTLWYLKQHLIKRDFFRPIDSGGPNEDQRYVLVIDEINRGNIAGIFGELITLIEKDKREGCAEAFPIKLPYSKADDFLVPPNLYLIGTMNTADRSVEALDTALRRRFSFVEMPSRPELVQQPAGLAVELQPLLAAINGRIERLLDKDHHIGHSYFMGIHAAADPEAELRLVFKNKVLPLLQEYFYGDPRKLGAVLGPAWVKKREASTHKLFGKFDIDDAGKEVFDIADPMAVGSDAFTELYA